jgi:O-antigen ligase
MSGPLARKILFLLPLLFPFAQERVLLFHVPIYAHEGVLGLAFLLFLLSRKKALFPPRAICSGVALLFLGVMTSLLWNDLSAEGLGIIKSWFFFPILAAFLFLQYFRERTDQLKFLVLWFAVDALVALIAVFVPPAAEWTYDGRLKAFFPSPNHLAMFLEPGFLIGVFFFMKARERKAVGTVQSTMMTVIAAGIVSVASAVLLTRSKAAAVALVVALLVAVLLLALPFKKARRAIAIVGIALVLLFGTVLASNWSAFSGGEIRSSLASRVMIWNATGAMIADHPLFGIGPGNFQTTYLAYQSRFPSYLEWAVPHPHNIVFAFWLNAGLIGLVGFFQILFLVIRETCIRITAGRDLSEKLFPSLLLAFFVTVSLHGMVDTLYFKNEYALFFWIFVAFSLGTDSRTRNLSRS